MVPASVRVKREEAEAAKAAAAGRPNKMARQADYGFGLAPVQRSAITSAPDVDGEGSMPAAAGAAQKPVAKAPAAATAAGPKQTAAPVSADAQYMEWMATMKELGAL
jgi:hypothetical protein